MNRRIPVNIMRENAVKQTPGTVFGSVSATGQVFDSSQGPLPSVPAVAPQRTFENAQFQQFTFAGSLYIPYDKNRVYLMIQNQGATTMIIDFTGVSGVATVGLQLPGSVFAYFEPVVPPTTAVNITGTGFAITGSL